MSVHSSRVKPITLIGIGVCLLSLASCSLPKKQAEPVNKPVSVVTAPKREPILAIPPDGMITVADGETLYTIAARYQVNPRAIVEDNEIGPPYIVTAGQRLKLRPQRFHIVFPGDHRVHCTTIWCQRRTDCRGKWLGTAALAGNRPARDPAG